MILISRKSEIEVRKLALKVGGVRGLAKLLGIHHSTMYRYLTGFYPIPPEFAVRINLLAATVGADAPLDVDLESRQHDWLDKNAAAIGEAAKQTPKKQKKETET